MAGTAPHVDDTFAVEEEGVSFSAVFGTFAVTTAFIVVLVIAGFEIAQQAFVTAETEAVEHTGYPLLRETNAEAQALLTRYEPVSGERYRIPIDRAMDLIVNEAAASPSASSSEVRLTR